MCVTVLAHTTLWLVCGVWRVAPRSARVNPRSGKVFRERSPSVVRALFLAGISVLG